MAPIAVFTYKRPEHAARLLRSLIGNPEHASSDVYIFCDGPRGSADVADVERTRAVVHSLAPKHAKVIERQSNLGLANSIIGGVSQLAAQYGSVIVLEDDLLLSPFALRYFNNALSHYRDSERVMHVAGYMFPVDAPLPETFFYREATCWGWATWDRAWRRFEPDGKKIREQVIAKRRQHEFDVRGSMGFMGMLEAQIAGKVNSWAIRWYGSMRLVGGLALHPGTSLVSNRGFDGTGEHCSKTSVFDVRLADRAPTKFPDAEDESEEALAAMIAYRHKLWGPKRTLASRARRLLRLITGGV